MCTSKQFPTIIKIVDFGLSRLTSEKAEVDPNADEVGLGPDGLMTSPVGTPNFAAPEMLSGLPYGEEVDCFACGVVMYWLFCNYYPFADSDPDRLLELIKQTDFEFPEKEWSTISDEAKQVIRGLLDRSPYERLTADQALQHAWFHKELSTVPIGITNIEPQGMLSSLHNGDLRAGGILPLSNVLNVRNINQSNSDIKRRHTSFQVGSMAKENDDSELLQPTPNRCVSWYR
ncbi:protein kinase domain containing protein [Gracilaria domingensis]|nr:protein kinase domain containing protein [Gracilaria domingensis]